MATGYTSKLHDGEVSFEEFVWRCARAFGANVGMRDMGLDAPVVEYQPSPYNLEQLAKAQKELTELVRMNDEEITAAIHVEHQRALDTARALQKECAARHGRYQKMIDRVQDWTPPTPEHHGLKSFMLEQLRSSIEHDCHDVTKARLLPTIGQWRVERREKLQSDIEYYRRKWEEEVERTNESNAWNRALRESVPQPEKK